MSAKNYPKSKNRKPDATKSTLRTEWDYKNILQRLPIGVAVVEAVTGNFIQVNKKFTSITGYSEMELLEMNLHSITYPEDVTKDLDKMKKVVNGKFPSYRMEKRYIHKDGHIIWVDLTVDYMDETDEKEIGYRLASIIDITKSKLAQQELKASEELLRTVINNAPITIFATNDKGVFTLHAGKAVERVGMKPGENVGVSAYELFSELQITEHNGNRTNGKSILDRLAKGEHISGISELNDVIFDNQFAPIIDENNKVAGMIGVATDITEQKKTEKERLNFEKRYRQLFNKIDEGFCIIEILFDKNNQPIDYLFLEVNPAFEKLTGLTNTKGKRVREIIPDNEEYWYEIYGRIALTGKSERLIKRTKSLKRWYDIYAFRFGEPEKRQVAILFNDITERKQAEEELRKRERELNEAQRLAKIGSWEWDLTTDTISWSEEYYRIYGFDPKLPPPGYKEHLKAYNKESQKRLNEAVTRSMQTGEPYEVDLVLNTDIVKGKWIRARSECRFDKNNKIIGLHGTAQDITDRKRREDDLRYRTEIATHISEGIALIRVKDEIIVHTNRRFEEMFGYEHGQLINKHARILNVSGKKHGRQDTYKAAKDWIKKNGTWKGKIHNLKKDGTPFYTQTSVTKLNHPGFGEVFIIVQMDITEQIQAENALRENEKRQAASIANISDVIAIVDENQVNIYKSPNEKKWFGWKPEELIGKSTFETIHPDDVKKLKKDFTNLLTFPEITISDECRYRCKNNSYKWIKLTAVNRLNDKNINGILVNYHDISNRKHTREMLIRHEKELKLLSAELINIRENEKKNLAQELHDEIGQSLTAMKMNLAAINKSTEEKDKATKIRLQETGHLLDNILSRVHEISLNLRPAMLDVLGFVSTVKSYGQQFYQRTGIQFHFIDNSTAKPSSKQSIHLFRIIQEALTNTTKYAKAQNVTICLNSNKRWFSLTIKDDGTGFDTKERTDKNIGIGLIGMNERVNSMQGKIQINPVLQKGTKINIKVPLDYGKE